MKTLNEQELAAIDGGSIPAPSWPLSTYVPSPRPSMNAIEGSLSVTPSYLNG